MATTRKQRRDAYKRIRSLGHYERVVEWLRLGVAVTDIVAWLLEHGAGEGVEARSLRRSVERLRRDVVPGQAERDELLDELRELIELARTNWNRIESEAQLEIELGRLLPEVSAAIRAQLETLTRIAEIKKRLGLRPYRATPHRPPA